MIKLMSINNYILNLLNIKDNNICILSNKLETKIIKMMVIYLILTILENLLTWKSILEDILNKKEIKLNISLLTFILVISFWLKNCLRMLISQLIDFI